MTDGEQTRRRSYGRGVIEGLRLAGIKEPGDYMNAAKLARLESSLNAMEKKVLAAIPMQECWPKHQIIGEMKRMGSNPPSNVVEACLSSLKDKGLIKEQDIGQFVRVSFGGREMKSDISDGLPGNQEITTTRVIVSGAQEQTGTGAAPPKADTLLRLANLAVLLRRAADEAEAIAMDVEERVAEVGQDVEKLRRLQSLLKDIGVGG